MTRQRSAPAKEFTLWQVIGITVPACFTVALAVAAISNYYSGQFAALNKAIGDNRQAEIKEHGEIKDLITPLDKRLVAVETKIEHVSDSCGPMKPQDLIAPNQPGVFGR